MDISALQTLENQGAHTHIEGYLRGEAIKKRDAAAFKYGSAYYVRRGKPAASLECYSHYLNFEKETGSDPEAVSLAIDMAYRLEKFSLVRDYLFSLTPKARENLATPTLILAIHSFIYLGQATEAEKIASFLRHRANAPQLPSFDAMVNEKFGSTTKAKEFIQQHLNALPPKEFSADIQRSISIALAYMVENKHSEAEKVLLACKARHAA